ncbi:MAG: hypothetical protein ACOVQ0_16500 [Novosphingobium sp.]|uniref:hypothetical protein n=1 Tax=Novosphingobium sp. TaxID=1874826 RepID=UPI003B9A6A16
MSDSQSADLIPLVSRSAAGEAEARALRMFIGRGKRFSVKEAANGAGVKDRVIECAMAGPDNSDWRPLPAGALHSLMSFLGPDFITAWLKPTSFAAHDPSEVDHDELLERALNYVNVSARARRKDSPAGPEIHPTIEKSELDHAARDLRAAN